MKRPDLLRIAIPVLTIILSVGSSWASLQGQIGELKATVAGNTQTLREMPDRLATREVVTLQIEILRAELRLVEGKSTAIYTEIDYLKEELSRLRAKDR